MVRVRTSMSVTECSRTSPVGAMPQPQRGQQADSGSSTTTSSGSGMRRRWPRCPGWPPGLRPVLARELGMRLRLGSDDGGSDEFSGVLDSRAFRCSMSASLRATSASSSELRSLSDPFSSSRRAWLEAIVSYLDCADLVRARSLPTSHLSCLTCDSSPLRLARDDSSSPRRRAVLARSDSSSDSRAAMAESRSATMPSSRDISSVAEGSLDSESSLSRRSLTCLKSSRSRRDGIL